MRRKRILLRVSIMMILLSIVLDAYQAFSGSVPGVGTVISSRGTYSVPNGTLKPINALAASYFSATGIVSNNTISFDVLGTESSEPSGGLVYNVTTTGAMTITYLGFQPRVICGSCSAIYNGAREVITYSGAVSDVLVVVWSGQIGIAESQLVLFRDDFLYTNPLIESSWTIDQYTTPGINSGEYTSSGYLVMKANTIQTETVHVTNPIYNPVAYATGTAVKRKMTVAFIPFAKTEASTASIAAGMGPLLTSGVYPGNTPYGTPSTDYLGTCSGVNPIGLNYMVMDNSGAIFTRACGDGGNSATTLETVNPSLYTVFTIETYGIFCSTCLDNAYTGTSWVWFRAYQEDSTGRVISSTDKNLNLTSNIAPLYQTAYAFVNQQNNNAGATGQISKIDFVQVQNYGSPVCLVAVAGAVCTRLPPVPSGIIGNNGLVGLMAWLANQLGFGDEQLGALILFLAIFTGAAFIPWFFTRNISVGTFGAMLTLGFFTYVGFLPIFTLIIVFLGGAAVVVMVVMRVLAGTSMGGGQME